MQRLGKNDVVILTHVGEDGQLLHRTTSGYQFGIGPDVKIVTSVDQLDQFSGYVKAEVTAWLEKGGVEKAQRAKLDREVAESASELPGTLDALADKLGPDVKANLFALLKQALTGGELNAKEVSLPESRKKVDGGMLISRPGKPQEFVPDENIGDEEEGQPALLPASGPDEGESLSSQMEENRAALKAPPRGAGGRFLRRKK